MRGRRSDGAAGTDAPVRARPRTEDVLIRNHDFQWGYDLDLTVREAGGTVVFDERYYLQPGATRHEVGVIDPGAYTVRAVLDNDRGVSRTCHVGDAARDGVLVELGNGTVSVHDGLYG